MIGECPAPVDSEWWREAPELGEIDGNPVICTSRVTKVWFERGEWWVDFINTFEWTTQQGSGTAAATTFVGRRTRRE